MKQLEAGNQFSIILDTQGNVYLWGNPSGNELECRDKERVAEGEDKTPRQYQGNIEKVAVTEHAYVALLKDGTVAYTGLEKDNALLTNLPAELTDGSVRVVDIAACSQNAAAIDENGKIWVWGVSTHSEKAVPELESKPVKIYGIITPFCWKTAMWWLGATTSLARLLCPALWRMLTLLPSMLAVIRTTQ